MKGSKKDKVCFVSIDVEHDVGTEDNKSFQGVENMGRLLAVFQNPAVPLTLFVTGDVLQKYPHEARNWSGTYEIASHSFSHRFFDGLTYQEKERDIKKFSELYRNLFGKEPKGFRAPSHVIDDETFAILEKYGFMYDSSVVPHYPPLKSYRGYKGKAPVRPFRKAGVRELPLAGQLLGVPLAGAWIRKLPFWLYTSLFLFCKPSYITLSMHSWDALDGRFVPKLEKILKALKDNEYVFKSGEQIAMEEFIG